MGIWKKGSRGSALGWVMVVIMVVMILLMSALTMSASHLYRYQRYHNRRQVKMTAISVAKTAAAELVSASGESGFRNIMDRMLEDSEEGEVCLSGLDERMGEVCLQYSYDGKYLVLTVKVCLEKETGQTKLTMRKDGSRNSGETWKLMGYSAVDMEPEEYEPEEDMP